MSSAPPDAAPPDAVPPDAVPLDPSGPALPAPAPQASGHGWLPRWLMQLSVIAATLGRRMSHLDAHRATNPTVPATIDVEPAWHLVGRAMRWITALVARIVAERKAALAATVPANRQTAPDALGEPAPRIPREAAPRERLGRDTCIDGKPDAEVVGQICADLSEAATLLQSPSLVRQIAEIAASARALLGGPDASWTPLPMIRRGCRVAAKTLAAAVAELAAAATPVPAPDTG